MEHADDAARRDAQARYEDRYFADSGFEREMVRGRRRFAMSVLGATAPRTVVEVGCGTDPLYGAATEQVSSLRNWVTVEPGERFADIAEAEERDPQVRLTVVRGYAEERLDAVAEAAGGPADVVLCLGVLQGVGQLPDEWLRQMRGLLRPGGSVIVTVANAHSLHRRLARAMGLIADEHELSDRDRAAGHFCVFDRQSLRVALSTAGFTVEAEGGYQLKPFTHRQMEALGLDTAVLDGLWALGTEMPELASEIYAVGRVR